MTLTTDLPRGESTQTPALLADEVLSESIEIPVLGESLMGGYLARPVNSTGPSHAVIVLMELFGVNSHVRDVCDRLASLGYLALAPDLYHRTNPGVELSTDDAGRAHGFALLNQLTRQQTLDDIKAAMMFLSQKSLQFAGVVGMSIGGHIAYLAAGHLDIPASVVLYGSWIPTTDIPLSRPETTLASTSTISGRMLILVGEHDHVVPIQHRTQIVDALRNADVEHELIEYPGVGHEFFCARSSSYDRDAADDAWRRIAVFLASSHQNLADK